jgi:hypothetical protein
MDIRNFDAGLLVGCNQGSTEVALWLLLSHRDRSYTDANRIAIRTISGMHGSARDRVLPASREHGLEQSD